LRITPYLVVSYADRDLAAPVATAMASAPISRERVFTNRIVASVACVALSIAGLVAVKVVELRLPAPRYRSVVSVMRIKAVVNVAIEAAWAVKPGTSSKECPAHKPIGPIVAIGSTVVRLIVEVPIGAHGSHSDIDSNLR
jgi:hypothetical protein